MAEGLQSPTSMAFLSNNSILFTQKEDTISKLILDNPTSRETLLELKDVSSKNESGLLGIAIYNNIGTISNSTSNQENNFSVFIFVTEFSKLMDQETPDLSNSNELRNRIYKYILDGQFLTNPRMILDLPAGPGSNHQGGKLKIGPDYQLYAVIGELQREGQLQNIKYDLLLDNSGVIFRVNPVDGSPSNNNPFLAEKNDSKGASIAKYHAYGIRNSFGIDFDPITVKLWDAENGQDLYDEINIVDQDLIAAGNWLWDLFQDRRE